MNRDDDTDDAIVGERGVTYGLQIPIRPPQIHGVGGDVGGDVGGGGGVGGGGRGGTAARLGQSIPRKVGVFGDESSSDSEDDEPGARVPSTVSNVAKKKGNSTANLVVGKMIARQMAAMDRDAKTKAAHAEALQQDASVFEYDAHVDAIQDARRKKVEATEEEKVARKSKYIAGLLETAEHRKKEQEVLFEKRLEKEREAEEEVYGTKERFVTGAYRRKLEEEEKWKVEQARKREEDEANAVEKKGSMVGFYSNYLNVVGGGGVVGAMGGEDGRVEGASRGEKKEMDAGEGRRPDALTLATSDQPDSAVETGTSDPGERTALLVGAAEGRSLQAAEQGHPLPDVATAPVAKNQEESPEARAARLKREREEKIAKAKARYAERNAKRTK